MRADFHEYPCEMYHIKKGDHAFIVIGKGDDAVICDPWAGKVFPMSRARDKLRNFLSLQLNGVHWRVVTHVNLAFHLLKAINPLERIQFKIETRADIAYGMPSLFGIFRVTEYLPNIYRLKWNADRSDKNPFVEHKVLKR